jgi:multidrug efflux pump subunit AcrA (membrane-fusion protein)
MSEQLTLEAALSRANHVIGGLESYNAGNGSRSPVDDFGAIRLWQESRALIFTLQQNITLIDDAQRQAEAVVTKAHAALADGQAQRDSAASAYDAVKFKGPPIEVQRTGSALSNAVLARQAADNALQEAERYRDMAASRAKNLHYQVRRLAGLEKPTCDALRDALDYLGVKTKG